MTLKDKLIVLRDKAGISQMTLAEQLGVSRQAISRWESGDAVPTMDKLKSLSKIYNVSLDWLCNEDISEIQEQKAELAKIPGHKGKKVALVVIAILLAAFILLTGLINNVETDGESNVAIDDIPGEIVNVTENNAFSLK